MTGMLQEDRLRHVPGSRVRVHVPLDRPELVPCRQRRRAKAPLTWLQQEPLTFGIFKWQLGETTLAVRPINLLLEGAHILPKPKIDKGIIRGRVLQRHPVLEQSCLLGPQRLTQKLADQPCTVRNGQHLAPILEEVVDRLLRAADLPMNEHKMHRSPLFASPRAECQALLEAA